MPRLEGFLDKVPVRESVIIVLHGDEGLSTDVESWATLEGGHFHIAIYIACAIRPKDIADHPSCWVTELLDGGWTDLSGSP